MLLSSHELHRFDAFELDDSARVLRRDDTPVPLTPKAFDVLAYLVMNPGRVITKDELLKAVWLDSFVEEGNLAQHISQLRKALDALLLGKRPPKEVTKQFGCSIRYE